MQVCLNARGSVCPRLAYPALMDVSFLLIVELRKKMNISFFMHSLYGSLLGDVSLPLKTISMLCECETVLHYENNLKPLHVMTVC